MSAYLRFLVGCRVLVLVLVVSTEQRLLLAREWSDVTGTFRVEADLVGSENGKVQIQKTNGEIVSVDLEQLSEADRRYILYKVGLAKTNLTGLWRVGSGAVIRLVDDGTNISVELVESKTITAVKGIMRHDGTKVVSDDWQTVRNGGRVYPGTAELYMGSDGKIRMRAKATIRDARGRELGKGKAEVALLTKFSDEEETEHVAQRQEQRRLADARARQKQRDLDAGLKLLFGIASGRVKDLSDAAKYIPEQGDVGNEAKRGAEPVRATAKPGATYPSTQLLTQDEIWDRAIVACGPQAPRGTYGSVYAYEAIATLEQILLIAGESVLDNEYYALARFMIHDSFKPGGKWGGGRSPFGDYPPEKFRGEDELFARGHYELYVDNFKFVKSSPDKVAARREHLLKNFFEIQEGLTGIDVRDELLRLRDKGPAEHNTLAGLSKVARSSGASSPSSRVEWMSIRDIFGKVKDGSAGSSSPRGIEDVPSPDTSQKSRVTVSGAVLREKPTGFGGYEPVKGINVKTVGVLGSSNYTDYKGQFSFTKHLDDGIVGSGTTLWIDGLSKAVWHGHIRNDLHLEIRIRKDGTASVRTTGG